jgi:hypothetical protein
MAPTQASTDGLRQVERARGQVWLAYLAGRRVYAGAVLLVTFGLVEDFAPRWSVSYFFAVAVLGLVFHLLAHTRRARALLRLPAVPRSAVLGTGHLGTRRSQALLVVVWGAGIVLAVVMALVMFEAALGGGNPQQAHPPVPATVVFTALALVFLGVNLSVRHWAQRKVDGRGRA